ncbi:hypothetical protein PCANC_28018 [Puccinia coronata f. sp. avenae]|uniref:Uncharacterized protein n=1 Tax=Puccinia coronata f. sp. avenae TaxID=200324 RepID=A0A2N5S831_9BASI|nr:hypothetical protein PCANC_28018 [Puccinia coronata f. sp. avenae]
MSRYTCSLGWHQLGIPAGWAGASSVSRYTCSLGWHQLGEQVYLLAGLAPARSVSSVKIQPRVLATTLNITDPSGRETFDEAYDKLVADALTQAGSSHDTATTIRQPPNTTLSSHHCFISTLSSTLPSTIPKQPYRTK